jgi:hypothetical protein
MTQGTASRTNPDNLISTKANATASLLRSVRRSILG